jgi:uncharacterized protein (TIGR00369 family)
MPDIDFLRSAAAGRYWAHLGIEQVECANGASLCRVELREHHLNYNDVAHGGVVSGLVDSAAGLAIRSIRTYEEIAERPHATSDLHVTYLAPARGAILLARGRVIKSGRTAIFTEVEVEDDQGRLVARGSATFVIGTRRAGPAD